MVNNNTIITLYNFLGVNRKIKTQSVRIRYLRDVWGLDQNTIAKCEEISQATVSKLLFETKFTKFNFLIEYAPAEIELLQKLPRELIADVSLISFVNNILKLNPNHSFYTGFGANTNLRIAGLSALGVQNKFLEKMFNKTQPTVSMNIKRNIQRVETYENSKRYVIDMPLTFSSLPFGGKAYVD